MKVKRLPDNAGYTITHDTRTYKATREGGMFLCNGILGTMREIKDRIAAGGFPTPSANAVPQDSPTPDCWDCLDPCALLVLRMPNLKLNHHAMRTLDCYGWIDVHGNIDTERADRLLRKETARIKGAANEIA